MSTIASIGAATRPSLAALALTLAFATAAQASAGRTFVASTGNDNNTANNCALATPCRTFQMAYGVTSSGGEIVALDAAGYGTLSITGPISIVGVSSASITVPTAGTGITVGAGSSDVVILKNIQINGVNAANTTGIALNGGRMILQNATLKLLTTGLSIAANTKSDVVSTDIIGNTTAISTSGTGSVQNPSPGTYGPTQVRVIGGSVTDNGTGFLMASPGVDAFSNQQSTIMIFAPGGSPTTDITGNATLLTCTGQTCTHLITYQAVTQTNGGAVNVD